MCNRIEQSKRGRSSLKCQQDKYNNNKRRREEKQEVNIDCLSPNEETAINENSINGTIFPDNDNINEEELLTQSNISMVTNLRKKNKSKSYLKSKQAYRKALNDSRYTNDSLRRILIR